MKLNDKRKLCLQRITQLRKEYGFNPSPENLSPQDRKIIGTFWEIMFCVLAWKLSKRFTPQQIGMAEDNPAVWYGDNGFGRSCYLLPDITVWSFPGEHHEIKHKNPFVMDSHGPVFGLEEYRLAALLDFQRITQQDVLYTIHNYDLADGNLGTRNSIDHWLTVPIDSLANSWVHRQKKGKTIYNGRFEERSILYWPVELWSPLALYWEGQLKNPIVAWAKEQDARIGLI